MLGRVTIAHHDLPVTTTEANGFAISEAAIRVRHLADAFAEAAEPAAIRLDLRLIPARSDIEVRARRRRFAARVCDQHTAGNVLQLAHPEFSAGKFARQPTRITDMVRVHVGDDHAPDGPAAQTVFEDGAPGVLGFGHWHAGIDDGPATLAIIDQPEIYPFQRKRQAHAHPVETGNDLCRFALLGDLFIERVSQAGLCRRFRL